MSVVELTRQLLEIPSVSGEERAIGEFIAERLRKHFQVTLQPVGNRFNILATCGEPRLLLTTHMDTVPQSLAVKEDDTFLYGRGACDTKGIIAAMICAAEDAAALGIRDFGLLFDVSEESDFSGIKEAIRLADPEIVVVGEPTGLKAAVGQKGLIGLRIRCTGNAAPGATPELGVSAIAMLIDELADLKRMPLPETALGKTTMNIGTISGGVAANIVADAAEAFVEIRTTTANAEMLKCLQYEIEYSFEPVFPQQVDILGQDVERIVVPYFTEMYFWAQKATAFVFGPGDYAYAHTPDERVAKAELEEGRKAYLEMLRR